MKRHFMLLLALFIAIPWFRKLHALNRVDHLDLAGEAAKTGDDPLFEIAEAFRHGCESASGLYDAEALHVRSSDELQSEDRNYHLSAADATAPLTSPFFRIFGANKQQAHRMSPER